MTDIDVRDSISRLLSILRLDGVQVEVEEGVVYLEGVAESAAHKQLLENLVRRLHGVRSVVNCLALEHLVHWSRLRDRRRSSYQKKEQWSYGYQ
jgi:osmotically-inducible protein OsmY